MLPYFSDCCCPHVWHYVLRPTRLHTVGYVLYCFNFIVYYEFLCCHCVWLPSAFQWICFSESHFDLCFLICLLSKYIYSSTIPEFNFEVIMLSWGIYIYITFTLLHFRRKYCRLLFTPVHLFDSFTSYFAMYIDS